VPGFLGHRELAQVYAAADAHVSASAFETLGNTPRAEGPGGGDIELPADIQFLTNSLIIEFRRIGESWSETMNPELVRLFGHATL